MTKYKFRKTKLLLLFIALTAFITIFGSLAIAQSIPSKPGTNTIVFDYAGMVSKEDALEMQRMGRIIEDKTKAQIVAVTVKDLSGMEIEDYAVKLFREDVIFFVFVLLSIILILFFCLMIEL